MDAVGLPHADDVGGGLHAAGVVVVIGHAVDVVALARPAPARAGDVAGGGDVAVAGGLADELVPGADADQYPGAAAGRRQHGAHSGHVAQGVGTARKNGAEISGRPVGPARARRQRQPGIAPAIEAAVEQADVGDTGIQQQVGGARGRQVVAAVQHHRHVAADAARQQQRQQGGIVDLVPQGSAFEFGGIDVAGAGDVAGLEVRQRAVADLQQAPWPRRRRHGRRAGEQAGQPGRRDQLAPARQVAAQAEGRGGGVQEKREEWASDGGSMKTLSHYSGSAAAIPTNARPCPHAGRRAPS